jgi:hypothetical protein
VWWTQTPGEPQDPYEVATVELDDFEYYCTDDQDTEVYALILQKPEEEKKDIDPRIQAILEEFKEVFQEPTGLPPSRPENHKIVLESSEFPPIRGIRRLDEVKLKVLKETLETLLRKNFIRVSESPYGANVLFARKSDGSFRLCIDYRGLNSITKKDATPLPHLGELRDRLKDAKYFTKMDLRDGFYNILMHPEDRPKTAFRTRYGHYEWNVLPMGLCNSPATFQKLMNRLFGKWAKFFHAPQIQFFLPLFNALLAPNHSMRTKY